MLRVRGLAVAGLLVAAALVPAQVALAGGKDAVVPGPRDTYGVGRRVLDLEDRSRATPADPEAQDGPIAAADERALPTTILYPTGEGDSAEAVDEAEPARGRFPVILFSHGAPGTPDDYGRMLRRWVSEGFVVIAPEFPISATAGPTDVAWQDARDQIRDARFVLTRVLARNGDVWRDGGFGGRLDRSRISAVGHSMGGFTTLGLVSDCCRDHRIKAALVLAGVSKGEDGPAIEQPRAPIMFVHASLDIAVPFRDSERAYADADDPRYLMEIRVPLGGIAAHLLPIADSFGTITKGVHRSEDAFLAADGAGDVLGGRTFFGAASPERQVFGLAATCSDVLAITTPILRGQGGSGTEVARVDTTTAALDLVVETDDVFFPSGLDFDAGGALWAIARRVTSGDFSSLEVDSIDLSTGAATHTAITFGGDPFIGFLAGLAISPISCPEPPAPAPEVVLEPTFTG